jgi:hypothetical protein
MTNKTLNQAAMEGLAADDRVVVRPARFGGVSELPLVRGIVDVTMVGLLGGGPRLAIRAARVLLEDSYAARSAADRVPTHAGMTDRDD